MIPKLLHRLRGLPRSPRELERSLAHLSVLRGLGWARSMKDGAPVDADGCPLPWYTYPALEWLRGFIRPEHSVFEWGAGNSTLWYAKRALNVRSIESDSRWASHLGARLPANASIRVVTAGTEAGTYAPTFYPDAIKPTGPYDIIAIDGMERSHCAYRAPSRLARGGVIIFDNSDRPMHAPGLRHLEAAGFARVDFVGPIPGFWHLSCTSVFARDLDALKPTRPPEFLGF
jgi:hypothetical protein